MSTASTTRPQSEWPIKNSVAIEVFKRPLPKLEHIRADTLTDVQGDGFYLARI